MVHLPHNWVLRSAPAVGVKIAGIECQDCRHWRCGGAEVRATGCQGRPAVGIKIAGIRCQDCRHRRCRGASMVHLLRNCVPRWPLQLALRLQASEVAVPSQAHPETLGCRVNGALSAQLGRRSSGIGCCWWVTHCQWVLGCGPR